MLLDDAGVMLETAGQRGRKKRGRGDAQSECELANNASGLPFLKCSRQDFCAFNTDYSDPCGKESVFSIDVLSGTVGSCELF